VWLFVRGEQRGHRKRPEPRRADRHLPTVAVLDHTAVLGGAELALERLLDHADGDLFTARTILFSDGPLATRLRETGHHVEIMPLDARISTVDRHVVVSSVGRTLVITARAIPFAIRLGLRLRDIAPDVIYSTSLKADLIAVPASWIAGRPLVWHVHDRISNDYLPPLMVSLIQVLGRHAPRRVIANSTATAATLPGVRRIAVANPGFTPDQLGARPSERVLPRLVVGIVGRVSPTKGQLEFVEAAARVLEVFPTSRFKIIGSALFGEKDYAESVHRRVRRLGIEDAVEFTGFVDDPMRALDALSLCVHASPVPEPFGQVVVEAMVRGVPVIATRGGGISDILEPANGDGPLGWLVPPGDSAELAAAILEVLANPAEAHRRAEAAWRSAAERFTIAHTAAAVSDVILEVSAGNRAGRRRRFRE